MKTNIKMIIMDVDGTLTDGKLYFNDCGEIFKSYNVKDGYGIKLIIEKDIIPVILTGKESKSNLTRFSELGVVEIHQNINHKIEVLDYLIDKYNINYSNVAYIGDDINDIECIKVVEISGCPLDAHPLIIKSVNFVCKLRGGNGAVREFIDFLLFN